MAGVKGKSGGARPGAGRKPKPKVEQPKSTNWGGARPGSGPKPKQDNQPMEVVVAQTKEEILANYELRLRRVRERLVAEACARLDCGADQVKALMDMGMMPSAFTESVKAGERAHLLLQEVRSKIDLIGMDHLKKFDDTVKLIEMSQ